MMKSWLKAGMESVLLWVGMLATTPGDAIAAEQKVIEHGTCSDKPPCNPAEIQQLESKARAFAVPKGCKDIGQCRSAPVGARACGGPREYIAYCAPSTDEDRLQRALGELARREDQYNRQCGIVSTCELVAPPALELVDGVCRTVPTRPADVPQ